MAELLNQDDRAAHSILATSGFADDRTRVLKHGDTFAVLDHCGGMEPGGLGEEGLYHEGTRFLSCLSMDLEGKDLFFLGPSSRAENGQLAVALTNPDQLDGDELRLPFGTLFLALRTFLWQRVYYQQLHVKNYGLQPVETSLYIRFDADFADIFEVRGMKRRSRGVDLAPEISRDTVTLSYRGLDGVVRRTSLQFTPRPAHLESSRAEIRLSLPSQAETDVLMTVSCERGNAVSRALSVNRARLEAQTELERYSAWSCHIHTSDAQMDAWIDRASCDLRMMTTDLPTGPYPYAGLPWFNTPFGRDGIITALQCLWLRPGLARGVLAYLAATQAKESIAEQDAEPGKILHETRSGEMAALGEMPFGRYYGSVDATPLFVLLAGAYYERTGDRDFVRTLWPHIDAAISWIDQFGDRDGDGFVEYHRKASSGLLHQGWKDSDDAVFHADGSPAEGPIALCEVQAYVFAARRAAASLASALGYLDRAAKLTNQAKALQTKFEVAFWCDALSTYVIALDGEKRPCQVRTSNAGHCLFGGIASPARAMRVGQTLLSPDSFSDWGIRTVAASEARYNPMGYHNGSVWPHDSAMIALGLARYGFEDKALRILTGLFEASMHFDMYRMPELFCGFQREPNEGPVLYPVACSPQAWSAASVFLLIQACLGLEINALESQISFTRPQLPPFLGELRIHNLQVAGSSVNLLVARQERDVSVDVLQREGDVQILVVK
jgi:glycogen debranching enzyme